MNDMLEMMTTQSKRMERLVQDLLLLSRLESHQPDMGKKEVVNVALLLKQVIEDAKSLSGGKHKFRIDVDNTLQLSGVLDELRSAFSNIVYNAVRYTPDGGLIEIQWLKNSKGKHFSVKDTGIGIPKKYIPRVTQRFYRVDKSRPYGDDGGTGLGLAIVKHVLLRHNGSLSIKSEENVGSTFCCTFK